MSTQSKLVKSLVWGGGIIGLGVLLLEYTVPTEESLRKNMSKDLQRQVERLEHGDALKNESARLMAVIKENAQSDRPVWDVRGLSDIQRK
ncbi:hypothetical protein H9P43_000244 [Blastocladiella emersonii ATCC 22665]|nr:hypothetical protein H9P43_000244 [Blastocladiella emersonii ATCC 22665]